MRFGIAGNVSDCQFALCGLITCVVYQYYLVVGKNCIGLFRRNIFYKNFMLFFVGTSLDTRQTFR